MLLAVPLDRREGRAGRDEALAVGPLVQVLGLGLVQPRRVAEREDDGPVDVLGHFADDFLGEGAWDCRCADEHMRMHFFDHAEQVVVLFALPFRILASVWYLSRCQVAFFRLQKQAGFVDTPDRAMVSSHSIHGSE